jgi:hypothetical protein
LARSAGLFRADSVAKLFLLHRTKILRAVGAPARKSCGGIHHQTMNSLVISVVDLRAHRAVIAARFVFQRENGHMAFWDFCNTICHLQKLSPA